jgi:hypothetical protein
LELYSSIVLIFGIVPFNFSHRLPFFEVYSYIFHFFPFSCQRLKLGGGTVVAAAWWRQVKLLSALAAAQQHGSGSVVVA